MSISVNLNVLEQAVAFSSMEAMRYPDLSAYPTKSAH
jgi:hypothetical protein